MVDWLSIPNRVSTQEWCHSPALDICDAQSLLGNVWYQPFFLFFC